MASISPLPSSTAGLGNTIGTLGERADGGSFSTVRLSSLPWQDVIHGTNTYMYDSRYYASSRVFNKSGTIKVDTTYLNNNSVYLANNTKTISISANH